MSRIALITGATAGIGKATAEQMAKEGYKVIISGRRKDRLSEMEDRLRLQHNSSVISLEMDVRNRKDVDKAIDSLPDEWQDIEILINNAGLAAGLKPIHEGAVDDWDQMIDTNVKGLLYVSRKLMPRMAEKGRGHIINLGSIAGKEVYSMGNVYCATKHAVDALTKAMRIDLLTSGVAVTQIAPGMVDTEFSQVRFKGDEKRAEEVYKGFEPLHAEDIAETVLFVLNRPAHVTINDILIMPKAQADSAHLDKEEEEIW